MGNGRAKFGETTRKMAGRGISPDAFSAVDTISLGKLMMRIFGQIDPLLRAPTAEPFCDYRNPQANLDVEDITATEAYAYFHPHANAQWSRNFAHGADMLFPITELAGKMLRGTRETVDRVGQIIFARPVTGELEIRILDGTKPAVTEPNIAGSFVTSAGRTLYFSAKQTGSVRLGQAKTPNTLANSLADGATEERDDLNFSWTPSLANPEIFVALDRSRGLAASTVADVLTHLAMKVFHERKNTDVPWNARARLFLVHRMENMPTAPDFREWFGARHAVEIAMRPYARPLPSGMRIVKFDFRFPEEEKPVTVHLAYTYDPEVVRRVGK
jgi:hypothetical protein